MDAVLRDVVDDDLEVFFEQQLDPQAVEMAAFPAREREKFFEHWERVRAGDTNVVKTIVVGGEVVGNVVSWLDGERRLVGYWLGREFWGRGLATRALAEFAAEVTERPLYAEVSTANIGSIRVLEKCGFIRVGSHVEQTEEFGEIELIEMKLVG